MNCSVVDVPTSYCLSQSSTANFIYSTYDTYRNGRHGDLHLVSEAPQTSHSYKLAQNQSPIRSVAGRSYAYRPQMDACVFSITPQRRFVTRDSDCNSGVRRIDDNAAGV